MLSTSVGFWEPPHAHFPHAAGDILESYQDVVAITSPSAHFVEGTQQRRFTASRTAR